MLQESLNSTGRLWPGGPIFRRTIARGSPFINSKGSYKKRNR